MSDRATAFRAELAALLNKYSACIIWTCDEGSDTYGITGDRIKVVGAKAGDNEVLADSGPDNGCLSSDDLV